MPGQVPTAEAASEDSDDESGARPVNQKIQVAGLERNEHGVWSFDWRQPPVGGLHRKGKGQSLASQESWRICRMARRSNQARNAGG